MEPQQQESAAILAEIRHIFVRLRTMEDRSDTEVADALNGNDAHRAVAPGERWTPRDVALWARLYRLPRRPGPRSKLLTPEGT